MDPGVEPPQQPSTISPNVSESRPAQKVLSEARRRAIEAMKAGKQKYEEKRKQLMATTQPTSEPESDDGTASALPTRALFSRPAKQAKVEQEEYEFVKVPKMLWDDKMTYIEKLREKNKKRKVKLQSLKQQARTYKEPEDDAVEVEEDDGDETITAPMSRSRNPFINARPVPVLNYENNEFLREKQMKQIESQRPAFSFGTARALKQNMLENARRPTGILQSERSLKDKISGK
jgi:hypothetical protein